MMLTLTILSLSASSTSVGRICAQAIANILGSDHNVELIDIRTLEPVWVDDRGLTPLLPSYTAAETRIRASHGVILVSPVYCYTVSSPAKAITELFGAAFERMPVAFVSAAGSIRSHLATGDLMRSMMFEQSTFCYPKSVMATAEDLDAGVPRPELEGRLRELVAEFVTYARALAPCRQPQTTS